MWQLGTNIECSGLEWVLSEGGRGSAFHSIFLAINQHIYFEMSMMFFLFMILHF